MDLIDRSLLQFIQEDSRITVNELSEKLLLSQLSIRKRLQRLEKNGVIQGFMVIIPPDAIGKSVKAIIQIENLKIKTQQFEEIIKEEKDILECHRITRINSFFIKTAVSSIKQLEDFTNRLTLYGKVNTSLIIASPVSHQILLPKTEYLQPIKN
ncbi:Lrp/AsnC family transcriptional regulator [Priestia megaterium]|uniref:Lrp/AsnC family transcriptional regulator n=1 Tax=Priestia megaterium TaxID=1404 RepID=UPI00372D2861